MSDTRTYADRRDYMLPYLREYRRRRRLQDPEYAERMREATRLRRAAYPEAHRAHEAVRSALKSGRLIKPDTCERCGGSGPIEAAHDDYKRRLDVHWLCRSCHRTWDRETPKTGAAA